MPTKDGTNYIITTLHILVITMKMDYNKISIKSDYSYYNSQCAKWNSICICNRMGRSKIWDKFHEL